MKRNSNNLNKSRLSDLVISAEDIGKTSLKEAADTDSVHSFPEVTLGKLKSANLLTASIPVKYGGMNLGLVPGTNLAMLTILKNIGSGNLVMGRVLEGHINAQILINQFGSKAQKKFFAEEAFEGHLFGVWNTQAQDGTLLSRKKEGKHHLSGAKIFATGTGYVTRPVVTAAMKNGSWQMCIIPLNSTDVKIESVWWNPMGMKSSRSFKINFENIPVPKINLLGSAGEYYQQPGFSGGAVRFAAVQLGGAERLLNETKKYLISLNRTQDPFQKMRLGQMAIAVESGIQWLYASADRMDRYMKQPEKNLGENLIMYINMMRTAIEQICTEVMSLCQKCVGARGLNSPYHFERIIRDLSMYLRQPAPDSALADVGGYVLKPVSFSDNIFNLNADKNKKNESNKF